MQTAVYMPITAKQKLTIAAKDSFDYPLVGLAAVHRRLRAADQRPSVIRPGMGGLRPACGTWSTPIKPSAT